MEMDGDIEVAEQLGKQAEQCLASLARRMQLDQIKLEILTKREQEAEREEVELTRAIEKLKEMEVVARREADASREQLAVKSRQFQELTRLASERLPIQALQRETGLLRSMIAELQEKADRLTKQIEGCPAVDEVSILLAQAQALQRRFQQVTVEHSQLSSVVQSAISKACNVRAIRLHEEREETEYCRQLEEAIEDMTLLQAEEELSKSIHAEETAIESAADSADPSIKERREAIETALSRLGLLRKDFEVQLGKLDVALEAQIGKNRELARELGLLDEQDEASGHDGAEEAPDHQDSARAPTSSSSVRPALATIADAEVALSTGQKQNESGNHVEIVLD